MIVAATSSSNFRPEFRSSAALPSSPDFADHPTKAVISCILSAKSPSMFSIKYSLFFQHLSAPNPLFSTPSSLFFAKQGGRV